MTTANLPDPESVRRWRLIRQIGRVVLWLWVLSAAGSLCLMLWLLDQPWFHAYPSVAVGLVLLALSMMWIGPVQARLSPGLRSTALDEHGTQISARWRGAALRVLRFVVYVGVMLVVVRATGSFTWVFVLLGVSIALRWGQQVAQQRVVRQAVDLARDGHHEQAMQRIEGSWVMRQSHREPLLAALALDAGDPVTAERGLRHAVTQRSRTAFLAHHCSMLGQALADQGQLEEALTWCERAVSMQPEQSTAVLRHAVLQARLGSVDDATIERARLAVDLSRRSVAQAAYADLFVPLNTTSLAWVLAAADQAGEARRLLDEVDLPERPTEASEVLYRMGSALACMGDLDAARRHWTDGAALAAAGARRCATALAGLSDRPDPMVRAD